MSKRATASNTEHRMEALGQSTDTWSAKTPLQDYATTNRGYRGSDDGLSRGRGLPFARAIPAGGSVSPVGSAAARSPRSPLTSAGMNTGASQFPSKEQRPGIVTANAQHSTEDGEPRGRT
ncbi:hypothetical protein DL769_003396 [Monosporascus sp. CRB-8-3]|nr:hypothetical protein DL769_003396 [Monosporascus sp. CRB-8-3]